MHEQFRLASSRNLKAIYSSNVKQTFQKSYVISISQISLFHASSSFMTTLCHTLRNDLNAIPPLSLSFLHPRRFVNSRLLPSSGCSSIFFFFLFLLPNGRVKMMEGGETCIYNNGYNFLVLEALLLKLKVSTLKAPIRSPSR